MLSEFEAATLTKSRVGTAIVAQRPPAVAGNRIGTLLTVLSALAAVGLLSDAAADRNQGAHPVTADPTVFVQITAPSNAGRWGTDIAPAYGTNFRVPLFFGYVEFDWDPTTPGGVPGFGPWPSASGVEN